MTVLNFNNKTFSLVKNSENAKVNSETFFIYKQEGDLAKANYYGGTIKYGKIIAHLKKIHSICCTNALQQIMN